MPQPRRGAYYYRRKGRKGWYAFFSRDDKDISLNTEDENEAAARLSAMLDARRLRQVGPGDRAITEVFAEHLRRAATSQTRKSSYEVRLNAKRIQAWLLAPERNVNTVRSVTTQVVEDYKTSRHAFDKVSAARVNRELDTWRGAWKVAIEWEIAPAGALSMFAKLREPRPQPHQAGLTKKMIHAFLRAEANPGYRALFRLTVGSALRDEEVRHLDAQDIRPPWLHVNPKAPGWCSCCPKGWASKGYRHRQVPITKETARAAKLYLQLRDELSPQPKTVWDRIQAARKKAGIKMHFSMHDLRRAWASHMLAAGHRIEEISKWLGHADVMTTMRYLRVVQTSTPKPSSLPF